MYRNKKVCVVVPAHNEREHIAGVIRSMPDFVDRIVVVDDASSDGTAEAARSVKDPRVEIRVNPRNLGVGGAVVAGHRRALKAGADLSAVMAGDGQMDPGHLQALLDPLVDGQADFTKGNRFQSRATLQGMPRQRVWGNAALTILTKFASGYWQVFDPQNGYTAITAEALRALPLDSLRRDYLFENSVLCVLGLRGFRVRDVPIPAVYRGERSGIRVGRFSLAALGYLWGAFWRRIFVRYLLGDFHPVALFYLAGTVLLLWGLAFGALVVYWSLGPAVPTTGTVMLAVVPFFIGFQVLLTAVSLDITTGSR